jgi:hypothetical protein
MKSDEEYKLESRLRKLEEERHKKANDERISETLDVLDGLSSNEAKARLFGKSIGYIPTNTPLRHFKNIIDGYVSIGMYSQAANLSAEIGDYEKSIEYYLETSKSDRWDMKRIGVEHAAFIAKDKLQDTSMALSILEKNGQELHAVYQAQEWGELEAALRISEEHGFFQEARKVANKLGYKEKAAFYDKVMKVMR